MDTLIALGAGAAATLAVTASATAKARGAARSTTRADAAGAACLDDGRGVETCRPVIFWI